MSLIGKVHAYRGESQKPVDFSEENATYSLDRHASGAR
jgi:hypothetical protein